MSSKLKVYNTLSRRKEEFVSVNDREVSFYSCGPTVYDYFHIGNARVFIVFDVIRRYLEYLGYKVAYIQNFTDIDDKMIKKAQEENITVNELAEKYIDAYYTDAGALKIRPAVVHPRATEHIPAIIELIRKLLDKGLAYTAGGDVIFDTTGYQHYGALTRQNRDDLLAGARVEVAENKRSPLDFVLWKGAKPGEPVWESPWGSGRPGWHIECSAMAFSYLGETIDIHAGGPDLIFPHHENEKAQSEGATGRPFVKYWLHAGYLNMDSEKMSKSLGNVLNVKDLLKKYEPGDMRYFMLSSHYRSPLNFSEELLASAAAGRKRLQSMVDNLNAALNRGGSEDSEDSEEYGQYEELLADNLESAGNGFLESMNDDFNTAEALGVLFSLAREVNIYLQREVVNKQLLKDVEEFFARINKIFDILVMDKQADPEEWIKEAVNRREEARQNKDWAAADKIRDELKKQGIILEDTPHGPQFRRK